MSFMQAVSMAFFIALVDYLTGCAPKLVLKEGSIEQTKRESAKDSKDPDFHQLVETTVKIVDKDAEAELNVDIFRPFKKSDPTTLVIMVPGSGNVSRKGEVINDGINPYDDALKVNELWAKALADHGLFVLSYDKRTCNETINPQCRTNSLNDLEETGIIRLAKDLDEVCRFADEKLKSRAENVRIVLMTSTQGAQTVSLAQCAKKVNGIIMLSPIIGDLESMWVKGLAQAAKNASPNQKMRLMNQKESMAGFFKSLKKGEFPETSIIRGASVTFWRSWINASSTTLSILKANNRPLFLLFSAQDSFNSNETLVDLRKQLKPSKKISIKSFATSDRNFASKEGIPQDALTEILTFIRNLP